MALGGRGYRLPPLNAIEEARCVPDERQSLTPGSLMRQAAHGGGNMSEQLQLVYELNIIPGKAEEVREIARDMVCLLYTSPSPRDRTRSRMPSSA